MKCEYCNKSSFVNYSHHLAKCELWKSKKRQILSSITKDFLFTEHIEKHNTLGKIAKNIGLRHTRELSAKLEEFNIPFLNSKNSEQFKQNKIEAAKITSKKKYGYEFHLTSGSQIREKLINNLKNNFGVTNVYQLDYVKDKIKQTCLKKYGYKSASSSHIIRNKVKNTCMKKYGVDNVWKRKDIIEKMKLKRFKKGRLTYSKQSQRFFDFIFECCNKSIQSNIYYAPHSKEFGKYSKKQYYFYDFVIPELKFCIEYHGNYYHANPRLYKENDIFYRKVKAKDIWKKDKEKIHFLKKIGFEIWVIWELDYLQNTDLYFAKILKRIQELSLQKHLNQKFIPKIFESNITKDSKND